MASKTKQPVLAAVYGRRLRAASPPVCGGRESVLAHGGQTVYNQKKDTVKGGGAMTQLTQAAHGAAGYLFAAVMLTLGLWHFALYLRAMRKPAEQQSAAEPPKPEIFPEQAMYEDALQAACAAEEPAQAEQAPEAPAQEAGGRTRPDAPHGLDGADVGLMVIAALVGVLVRLLAAWYLSWPSPQRLNSYVALAMYGVAGPCVLTIACYAIIRRLGGGKTACALGALIAAASLMWDALGVPFAALALVFALRSMDEDLPRAANVLAAGVFAAFAAYLDAATVLFTAGIWAILLCVGPARCGKRALGGAALFPAACAAAYLVMQLPGALIAGVQGAGFWMRLWLRVCAEFTGLVALQRGLTLSADCVVCMLYGAICTALAGWALVKERDWRAGVVCIAAITSALALAFGALRFAPVASLFAAGYLWGRWQARGGKTQVLLGGGMLLALCAVTDAISLLAVW